MNDENHHRGLAHDLEVLRRGSVDRRRVLRWALGASVVPFMACDNGAMPGTGSGGSGSGGTSGPGGTSGSGGTAGTGSCTKIPEETAGPYPGDGSNGPNVLNQSGIVRSDIRASFGGMTGTAQGVPLTVTLNLLNSSGSCASLAGYAVYLWHCDRDGLYSLYSAGVTNQNYLRGVQETDSDGKVTFTTIFPGCYSGRWPHIHFEAYRSLANATAGTTRAATSQLALPQSTCDQVFASTGYQASVGNLQQISLAQDNVFSDGSASQLPTVSGDVAGGLVATLNVGVAG
jgi:protocatechuate 3,4-dioxygenase beta subunit